MSVSVAQGSEDDSSGSSGRKIILNFETAQAFFFSILSRIRSRVTVDTIRPLPVFLGITGQTIGFSPGAFTSPVRKFDKSTAEKLKSRIKLNLSFFLSNYALVFAGVALVVVMMHPRIIFSIVTLWGLWSFHEFLISNEVIVFGRNIGTLVSISHRSTALTLISFVVIVSMCLRPAITVIALSGILVMAHALLRDPNHLEMPNAHGRRGVDDDDEGGYTSGGSGVIVDRPIV
ncbi:unnamed protein product [Cylindrotheca closterium]|uniref:PRA1 family protein n=1 Tax=Cylindrotheca closterium TaxID=2856 RepID=A0AAD2JLD9_9STRA|nr:unnamed protein product [Cylindrotheca closterium]